MQPIFEKSARFLHEPVGPAPRLLLAAAAVLLVVTYFTPLWNLTMFAPQYPDGLRLDIYSHALEGGHRGQDIKEINLLNHYIGMHDLAADDFDEFKWMPFVLGGLALVSLRAIVLGTVKEIVDASVLFFYYGAFSLWSFGNKLYHYGHTLSPEAAVKVAPFMPPMFGFQQIANFEVDPYPRIGTYVLGAVFVLMTTALWLTFRQRRRVASAEPLSC